MLSIFFYNWQTTIKKVISLPLFYQLHAVVAVPVNDGHQQSSAPQALFLPVYICR